MLLLCQLYCWYVLFDVEYADLVSHSIFLLTWKLLTIFTEAVEIGDGSCLGYSACEELSGNVSIANDSCYGLKACSNSSDYSTVKIGSNSCNSARACVALSGYSVTSSFSCNAPRSCSDMSSGKVGHNSW
jgi:hypothetical protein